MFIVKSNDKHEFQMKYLVKNRSFSVGICSQFFQYSCAVKQNVAILYTNVIMKFTPKKTRYSCTFLSGVFLEMSIFI